MTSLARVCKVSWCERAHLAQGLCSGHYKRLLDGVDLEKPFRVFRVKTGVCRVSGCNREDSHRGLCKPHYSISMKYHMSDSQIETLLPQKRCQICDREAALVVDHDHKCCPEKSTSCGKCIRGMICSQCNSALGYFQDSPEVLNRASEYLSKNLLN